MDCTPQLGRDLLTERQVGKLANQWQCDTPIHKAPPQPAATSLAARLQMIGMPLKLVAVAMYEGRVGEDGFFEISWYGVDIRVDLNGTEGWRDMIHSNEAMNA